MDSCYSVREQERSHTAKSDYKSSSLSRVVIGLMSTRKTQIEVSSTTEQVHIPAFLTCNTSFTIGTSNVEWGLHKQKCFENLTWYKVCAVVSSIYEGLNRGGCTLELHFFCGGLFCEEWNALTQWRTLCSTKVYFSFFFWLPVLHMCIWSQIMIVSPLKYPLAQLWPRQVDLKDKRICGFKRQNG